MSAGRQIFRAIRERVPEAHVEVLESGLHPGALMINASANGLEASRTVTRADLGAGDPLADAVDGLCRELEGDG